jgi:hypothetical protein
MFKSLFLSVSVGSVVVLFGPPAGWGAAPLVVA